MIILRNIESRIRPKIGAVNFIPNIATNITAIMIICFKKGGILKFSFIFLTSGKSDQSLFILYYLNVQLNITS